MATNNLARSVDPITFEILSHRLHQIAKETGITLERVGGTVNTTQMKDYAAALYRANGEILSAGETTGWHVACAGVAVKRIIERFGDAGEIEADDVFILNDPYLAAIHQSDVYMLCPIHYRGKLVGWSGTFVHVMDIGAMSPGGDSPGASEIFHEGLRIPGLKLVERGKLRRDVFDTLTNMTRQPIMVGLDLKCQMAANNVAKSPHARDVRRVRTGNVGRRCRRHDPLLRIGAAQKNRRDSRRIMERNEHDSRRRELEDHG